MRAKRGLLFSLLALLTLAACRDEPAQRPVVVPDRVDTGLAFVAPSAAFIVGDADVAVDITVVRRNAQQAGALDFGIVASGSTGIVRSLTDRLTMDSAQAAATVALVVDGSKVPLGTSKTLTLSFATTVPVAGGESPSVTLTFTSPEQTSETRAGQYRCFGNIIDVDVDIFAVSDTLYYIASAPGFERRIVRIADTVVMEASSATGVEGYSRVADMALLPSGSHPDTPIYNIRSNFDDAEECFNLAVGYTKGDAIVPAVDYLTLDGHSDWTDCPDCTFTDGWLLPTFMWQAQLFEPDDNPWPVWVQRSVANPSILRVVDAYRGECPVAEANSAAPGAYFVIDISDSAYVCVSPQQSGFANPDVYPDGLVIADYGGVYGAEGREEAAAGGLASTYSASEHTIVIALPHRGNAEGLRPDRRPRKAYLRFSRPL